MNAKQRPHLTVTFMNESTLDMSLITSLTSEARRVAEAHGLDLDLVVSGKPQPLSDSVERVLCSLASGALNSLDVASEATHLALTIRYLDDEVHVRVEHDAHLPAQQRTFFEDSL